MFRRQTRERGASEWLGRRPIAYFCAEFGINDALPIYSGGLGVLAGDILQEAAARSLPFIGIGLFYRKGYFHQFIDQNGQEEYIKPINPAEVPLQLIIDPKTKDTLLIEVPIHERTVYAQVWKYQVGSVDLYLLDTDHWKNNPEDRTITDQLYAGDQTKRVQQELVLGVGGYRCLTALGIEPSLYHMNEGHSAFLSLELISSLVKGGKTIDQAVKEARKHLIFTNHTLVPAGNDLFPHELVRVQLGKYAFESQIGIDKVLELGTPRDQADRFAMAILAMRMSNRSNAVSKLHAKKAKDLWPDFSLQAVTNGVHLPAWIAPELQMLYTKYAPQWLAATSQMNSWKSLVKMPNEELWHVHQELKSSMLEQVYAHTGIRLDPDALTIVWARRFATYKRPDLLFSDLERLKKILFHANQPVQIIVAGKSHPADTQGKELIHKIELLGEYDLKHRAVFVDDYSISLSKYLVSGADIWLNTPIYGQEASGTSGMKAAANGAIQCTVPDGWAYEVDWYGIGYSLAANQTDLDLYQKLETKIVPTYYKRGPSGLPNLWIGMMKMSIAELAPRFSATRMQEEYISQMYLPTVEAQEAK